MALVPVRWLRKHPLLLLALAATVGILAEDFLRQPVSWMFGGLCLLAWLPLLMRRSLWLVVPGVALSFALLHAWRLEQTYGHPLRLSLLSSTGEAREATVRGYLRPWQDGATLDPAMALCQVQEIRMGGAAVFKPMSAQIRLRLPQGMTWQIPGVYEITGRLHLPERAMNPGQFDPVAYSLRSGRVAEMNVRWLRLHEEDPWPMWHRFLMTAESCRQWMTRTLRLGVDPKDKEAGVVLAMALGASDAAGEDIEDAFRDSGTLHVFAVSGLHVVLLGEMVGYALFSLGKRRRGVAVIAVVFAYAFITGWRPSAVRAAIMMALVHAAPFVNRKSLVSNSLGAAALGLLAFDTHLLFLPGFQLSFAVLLAILLPGVWLMEKTRPWSGLDPFLPPTLASWQQRGACRARTVVASSFCTSAGALVGSLPLMGLHFHTLTFVALVSNLALVPMSGLCLWLACGSLLASCLPTSWLVITLNSLNTCLAHSMVAIVTWFASLPGGHVAVTLPGNEPPAVELQVLHLPYGGGACYMRSGQNGWLLDTGNETAWRRVVRPYLNHSGVNHLHGLVLTHADMGHAGAAQKVIQGYGTPALHTSALEPWPLDPPFASLRKLSALYKPDSSTWLRHGLKDRIHFSENASGAATARVLHPSADDRYEKADDRGLVLLLELEGFKILYLSDAGFVTEKALLARQADLRCDILIRHQHSADFSGLTEFLQAARPRVIVSSNDPYLPEEKMPRRVAAYAAQQGVPLFDLASDGSVNIQLGRGAARLRAHASGQEAALQAESAQ